MGLNVNQVDSTNVQIAQKNNLEKAIEEIKVFPTADEVADAGLGTMAINMRAAKYRNEINLPFGFSGVSDGYALGKGIVEQVEYNTEKVIGTIDKQKDEKVFSKLLRLLFGKTYDKLQEDK